MGLSESGAKVVATADQYERLPDGSSRLLAKRGDVGTVREVDPNEPGALLVDFGRAGCATTAQLGEDVELAPPAR